MGRVKTFDRDEVVRTAMNEIWRKGYDACSMRFLSEKLGLTRSSLYHSFESREALFLEVLQIYFEQSPDFALEQIDAKSQVLKEICKVFKNACFVRAEDPEHRGCLAINSALEMIGTNSQLGPVMSHAVQGSLERFEGLLKLAATKGELEDKDIHNKAIGLQNQLIGINVLCKIIHDGEELWQSTKVSLAGLDIYDDSYNL